MANVETTQSIYAAFGRGDVPFILGCLAEDVVWDDDLPSHGVGYLEPRAGRQAGGGRLSARRRERPREVDWGAPEGRT